MKWSIVLFLLTQVSFSGFSQVESPSIPTNCISIGLGNGGGSLLGIDYELIAADFIGIQGGLGFSPFGEGLTLRYQETLGLFSFGPGLSADCSINYHFRPGARSSMVGISYWYRFGNHKDDGYFVQSIIGASFVYRAPKWFTIQAGLGHSTSKYFEGDPKLFLLFSMGAYIPW